MCTEAGTKTDVADSNGKSKSTNKPVNKYCNLPCTFFSSNLNFIDHFQKFLILVARQKKEIRQKPEK